MIKTSTRMASNLITKPAQHLVISGLISQRSSIFNNERKSVGSISPRLPYTTSSIRDEFPRQIRSQLEKIFILPNDNSSNLSTHPNLEKKVTQALTQKNLLVTTGCLPCSKTMQDAMKLLTTSGVDTEKCIYDVKKGNLELATLIQSKKTEPSVEGVILYSLPESKHPVGDSCIVGIATCPTQKNKGTGTLLMAFAVAKMKQVDSKGHRVVSLGIKPDNLSALNFFKKLGAYAETKNREKEAGTEEKGQRENPHKKNFFYELISNPFAPYDLTDLKLTPDDLNFDNNSSQDCDSYLIDTTSERFNSRISAAIAPNK